MKKDNEKRFELVLNVPDEIGIQDNLTGDVIVEKVPQNTNTIGFCDSIVTLLNYFHHDHQQVSKLNNILEGFLLDKGFTFDDVVEFLHERTEKK